MSIQAVAWAIDQKTGSPAGKVVLLCVANYADENGECWPSQETIAAETELSERSVREWLQKLEEIGLLTRTPRRREDGYRASDLIRLSFKNQPAKSAGKPRSHRQLAPILPAPAAAPTSFEPSVEPSAARERVDLDNLQSKLLEAAGEDKIHGHGAFDLSAILGLIGAGVDLETDILPAIKARAARLTRPVRSWGYFADAIRDAYNRRIEAGQGLSQPKVAPIKRQEDMTEAEQRVRWGKHLNMARGSGTWFTWLNGPPPGRDGCRVPADMLEDRDLSRDWIEERERAA